jgi:hypothetical protein
MQREEVQQRLLLLTPVNSSCCCSPSTLWCSRSPLKKHTAAQYAKQTSREWLLMLQHAGSFWRQCLTTLIWYRSAMQPRLVRMLSMSCRCSWHVFGSPTCVTRYAGVLMLWLRMCSMPRVFSCRLLLHKNKATETLIELRAARIKTLHSVLASRGFAVPAAATLAAAHAAAADASLQQQQQRLAQTSVAVLLDDSSSDSFEEVQQRNQELMRKSRAQNLQIQAMEAVLNTAGVPLPRRTLDSTSLSSCSSASSMSSGDDAPPAPSRAAAMPARTPVVAAACVIPKAQQVSGPARKDLGLSMLACMRACAVCRRV